jgi:hypothetical protein
MKVYMAMIASIAMLATTAFDRVWAAQYGTDHQTPAGILTSTAPSAPVILTASQRGGGMHGGASGRANLGQRFNARPFERRSFDRGQSFHRDFDRDRFRHRDFDRDRFRHRFQDRDDFFFRYHRPYPYRYY